MLFQNRFLSKFKSNVSLSQTKVLSLDVYNITNHHWSMVVDGARVVVLRCWRSWVAPTIHWSMLRVFDSQMELRQRDGVYQLHTGGKSVPRSVLCLWQWCATLYPFLFVSLFFLYCVFFYCGHCVSVSTCAPPNQCKCKIMMFLSFILFATM